MSRGATPANVKEAQRRFAMAVDEAFVDQRPVSYCQGYDDGVDAAREIVEAIRERAAKSTKPSMDTIVRLLDCAAASIEKAKIELDKLS